MDAEAIEKKQSFNLGGKLGGLFGKIARLFTFRRGGSKERDFESVSMFKMMIQEVDRKDHAYPALTAVCGLCEEAVVIARQRVVMADKLHKLEDEMAELECFNSLSEEDAKKLKDLLDRMLSLTRDRNILRNQITGLDKSAENVADYIEDVENDIDKITEAEQNQRVFKQDMSYLQGEKSDLEYEQQSLGNALLFLNKFTIGLVAVFSIVSLVLGYLYIVTSANIFLPTSGFVLILFVVVGLMYYFRRRYKYELVMNIKKQQKAVEMLNTKSTVYAYYTGFLNYEYKKYKVRNAQMLKSSLSSYKQYKHLSARVDSVREIMYETEREIEEFLRSKRMHGLKSSVQHFAETINIEDKKYAYNELARKKNTIDRELTELDQRHEAIWDEMVSYCENDSSENKLVNTLVQAYVNECGKILNAV